MGGPSRPVAPSPTLGNHAPGVRMQRPPCPLTLVAVASLLAACNYFPDHHLVHPGDKPAEIVTWSDDVAIDPLLIHIQGARPRGHGPFPAVIVHPEGGKTAHDMQGVIWDLAQRGYVAIAADYERRIDGAYRWSLFAWRSPADVTAILDVAPQLLRDRPGPHRRPRLLAGRRHQPAHRRACARTRSTAVVSYYPVTDFPTWLGKERDGIGERFAFRVVRWYFRRESGAATDAEFDRMLRAASPYYVAESIEAPVLLVHGDRDRTAPVGESRRMAERLAASRQAGGAADHSRRRAHLQLPPAASRPPAPGTRPSSGSTVI